MKQYLLSIYQPEGPVPPPDALDRVMQDVGALIDEMKESGAFVFTGGLHPPSAATVVRALGAELLITDGPFAEGKEHIGGFVVAKAPDLDRALEWARKLARALRLPDHASGLAVEVRPFQGEV
jgi:hypothetical protein